SPLGGPVQNDVVSVNFATSDVGVFAEFDATTFVGGTATYVAQVNPSVAAIGDFDFDGMPDIVVANRSSNSISVMRSISNAKSLAASAGCPGAPVLGLAFDGPNRKSLRIRDALGIAGADRALLAVGTDFAPLAASRSGCPLLLS